MTKRQRLLLIGIVVGVVIILIGRWLFTGDGDTVSRKINFEQEGVASYYARSLEGRPTASGEIFSNDTLSAAHRYLPLGTVVRVTNLDNGEKVTVRINDRGPYAKNRIIDLSRAAATGLDFIDDGLTEVRVEASLKPQVADSIRQLAGMVQ